MSVKLMDNVVCNELPYLCYFTDFFFFFYSVQYLQKPSISLIQTPIGAYLTWIVCINNLHDDVMLSFK